VGARIHAQGAADGAGYPAIEMQACDARFGGGAGDLDVRHGGAGAQAMAVENFNAAEPASQPDDDTRNAAIANEDVGAEAEREDRPICWNGPQEVGQICFVGGSEEKLGWAADSKPGNLGKFGIGLEPAAQVGQPG